MFSQCDQLAQPVRRGYWSDDPAGAKGPAAGSAWGEFPLSIESELKAVRAFLSMLESLVADRITTTAHDETLLAQLQRRSGIESEAPEAHAAAAASAESALEDLIGSENRGCTADADHGQVSAVPALKGSVGLDSTEGGNLWRQICAVTYRLTRKRVVDRTLKKIQVLEAFLASRSLSSEEVRML